jgi:hypothetical protein
MTGEEIFEAAVETRADICRRCFKPVEATAEMDAFQSEGASCGDDCGQLSASLEDDPIRASELEIRADRLLSRIREEDHSIDEGSFTEAIDLLAGASEPPRRIFIDAIRAGRGDATTQELAEEYGFETKEEQRTRNLLLDLPAAGVSEQRLGEIDERVASEITTVVDSHGPGSDVYYVPDRGQLPEEYRPERLGPPSPSDIIRVVVEENEDWFWRASADSAESWLDELEEGHRAVAASALLGHIRSRQRYTDADTPSPEEQFRSSCLWPVYKDFAENIMGFLRSRDGPQALEELAEYIELSEHEARVLLRVLHDAELDRSDDSSEYWRAVER